MADGEEVNRSDTAKYTVKQSAWESAGFDGNPTPQPLMEVNPRSGCVMLAFPHHWWNPDEVELAYVPVTISLGEIDIADVVTGGEE